MINLPMARSVATTLLAAAVCIWGDALGADDGPLDLLVGRWDVHVKTLQPDKAEMTYRETYEWVLDRKFLRGRTEQKSDGTEDIIIATYDAQQDTYPF
jgi:hypothetical protein